ncbi:hypothetical protein SDJN03_22709, partial [Cucurbita argyrosperma subsp. sororia]
MQAFDAAAAAAAVWQLSKDNRSSSNRFKRAFQRSFEPLCFPFIGFVCQGGRNSQAADSGSDHFEDMDDLELSVGEEEYLSAEDNNSENEEVEEDVMKIFLKALLENSKHIVQATDDRLYLKE